MADESGHRGRIAGMHLIDSVLQRRMGICYANQKRCDINARKLVLTIGVQLAETEFRKADEECPSWLHVEKATSFTCGRRVCSRLSTIKNNINDLDLGNTRFARVRTHPPLPNEACSLCQLDRGLWSGDSWTHQSHAIRWSLRARHWHCLDDRVSASRRMRRQANSRPNIPF